MNRARKWLILAHRYLGIALGVLFVMWFVSGIAMIYAGGMPRLTADVRVERLPALDLGQVRLTPAEAASKAGLSRSPEGVTLLTILGRPAYRFAVGEPVTVFADSGDVLDVGDAESLAIGVRFMNLPASALHQARVLEEADQWTIGERRLLPLHKIVVDDAARTELYVSEQSGEVAVLTTRRTRLLAWVAAIPHWLYLAPLRLHDTLWRQVVLWASGLGVVAVLIGLVLAVAQFRTRYVGWMRWHYVTGVVFGLFALTWVFSGFLSMEPWDWVSGDDDGGADVAGALSGGALDVAAFPAMNAAAWRTALGGRAVKEVVLRRIQGEPYYVVRNRGADSLLVAATSLQVRQQPFPADSVVDRVRTAMGTWAILGVETLPAYDAYYHDRDHDAPLPVLRIRCGDPSHTWFYVDPRTSRLVARFTRRGRVERWLYHGLHSLDFPFWYDDRTAWEAGVVALCSGGAVLSLVGVVIGARRLRRSSGRSRRVWARPA